MSVDLRRDTIRACLIESTVSYDQSLSFMSQLPFNNSAEHPFKQLLLFLEHSDCYTFGASAASCNEKSLNSMPLFETDRGGQVTYHGRGQRIVYMMLNLKYIYGENPDIRRFINDVLQWIITSLSQLGVSSFSDSDNIGVWINNSYRQSKKIVSLGFKLKKWMTYHGVAINLHTDNAKFSAIKPCGLNPQSISSLAALGYNITYEILDQALLKNFPLIFKVPIAKLQKYPDFETFNSAC